MPILRTLSLGLAVLLGGSTAATASEVLRDAALGLAGEIYYAQRGACWQLFDDCPPVAESHLVMAVDILASGRDPQRLLVPETAGAEVEGAPALVFEDVTASLFVVWESKRPPNQSRVNLVWLQGGRWSPVIEVTGDVAPLKGPPQVVITRDEFRQTGAPEAVARHLRTVLHAVWWEQAPGLGEVYYTPIILDDGVYLGHNQVYNLSDLDPNPAPSQPQVLPPELIRSPRVSAGRDERSLVIGFVSPASGRFLVFESQVVTGELSQLADQVKAEMEAAEDLYAPESMAAFSERIRSQMIEVGARLHPSLLGYVTAEVQAAIAALAPAFSGDLPGLAERIRSQMIEVGARVVASGGLASGEEAAVGRILETAPGITVATGIHHAFSLQLVADRPAPAVGSGPTWIFLSEDGKEAVVSWEQAGDLLYRETRGGGWSSELRIELEGPIDAARAEEILRQRIRER